MTESTEGAPAGDGTGTEGGENTGTFGGFNTVEELVSAYEAAKKPAAPEAPKTGDLTVQKVDGEGTEGDGAADALKAAGLDQAVFTKEFAETGALSEKSVAALEKAGFSRETQEVYLDGLRARQAKFAETLYAPAGGQDGYKQMIAWAGANLDDSEQTAYNEAITSGDPARAKMAVEGLAARFRGAGPKRPGAMIHGKGGGGDSVTPFASRAEANAAISDPRYRTDPAYRANVAARLRDSTVY